MAASSAAFVFGLAGGAATDSKTCAALHTSSGDFIMSVVSLYAAAPLFFQLGIVAGCGIGFVAHRENGLRIDREHGLLLFPGEWRTMGLIIVVYALRY